MTKWEYRSEINCDDEALNLYGQDGWELSTVSIDPESDILLFYFKRPIEEPL